MNSTDDYVFKLVNNMLSQLHVSMRVCSWDDLNAAVFVTLYEGLCGEKLSDVVSYPVTKEDEIHNIQVVIDSLSMDVLNTSLSHISGYEVVNGNIISIINLVEVFNGLFEYVLHRIESDVSTDHGDDLQNLDDPDLVTPEIIDGILERELGSSYRNGERERKQLLDRKDYNSSREPVDGMTENTTDLIALGISTDSHRSPPVKGPRADVRKAAAKKFVVNDTASIGTSSLPDDSTHHQSSYTDHKTGSTRDLILEAQEIENQISQSIPSIEQISSTTHDASISSSVSLPQPIVNQRDFSVDHLRSEFDSLGVRPRPDHLSSSQVSSLSAAESGQHHTFTHHLYHHYDRPSVKLDSRGIAPISSTITDKATDLVTQSTSGLRQTLPSSLNTSAKDVGSKAAYRATAPPSVKVSSGGDYSHLTSMLDDTAEMVKKAIMTSPVRPSANSPYVPEPLKTKIKDVEKEAKQLAGLTKSLTHHTVPKMDLTKKNTGKSFASSLPSKHKHLSSPNKSKRKVSFLTSRSSDDLTSTSESAGDNTYDTDLVTERLRQSNARLQNPLQTRYTSDRYKNSDPLKTSLRTVPVQPVRDRLTETTSSRLVSSKDYDSRPGLTLRDLEDRQLKSHWDYLSLFKEDREQLSDDEASYHSDSAVDYGDTIRKRYEDSREADVSENIETELYNHRRKNVYSPKRVRFEDIIDDSAPGHMDPIRRKLRAENVRTQASTKVLETLYQNGLEELQEEKKALLSRDKKKAWETEKEYKQTVLTDSRSVRSPRKYQSSVLRSRPLTKPPCVKIRKRSASSSPITRRRRTVKMYDDSLLPLLLDEFPFLHLPNETLHDLWRKHSRQVENLTKSERDLRRKKTKAQLQLEEAKRRQEILMDIMRKEVEHNHRMREVKDRRVQQQLVKSKIREKRQQSARARKYYDEYQVRMRAKMLKRRTREEMIFKKLFKDGLEVQKQRIGELRKYAKEQREERNSKQQNELESLENYYRDQFKLLAESMSRERSELEIREKAQSKVTSQLKKELRKKMEDDIGQFQEQLYRDEDDAYFRQLDADMIKQQINLARYQTSL